MTDHLFKNLKRWIAATGLFVLCLDALAMHSQVRGDVLVEAHRGYSAIAPENTVASIDAAAPFSDLTEFDVRVTSDGELVLMHDSSVNRTTDGSGAIAGMTLAQAQTLDAGSWFSPAFTNEPVPTMAEAIAASQLNGIVPLIERKAGSAQAYHDEFVSLALQPEDFRVISFSLSFLSDLNALNPSYNLGLLDSGSLTQSDINSAIAGGADFLDWNHGSISQTQVDLVHNSGMELHVWTVDSVSRMEELIGYGIDGITTNDPEALHDLLQNPSELFGDLDQSHQIDIGDWLILNANRGMDLSNLTSEEAYLLGDLDEDFDNDIADFQIFKDLYDQANGSGAFDAIHAAPEPACLLLWLAGLLCFLFPRRGRGFCSSS